MNSPEKSKRRYLRFGLFELLLVTGVIAAWLPLFIANPQIPELKAKAKLYQSYSSDLTRVDPNQLCIRKLKRFSLDAQAWKYFLPAGAEMELRLATKQISSLGLPSHFDGCKLPEGEHRIYLREFMDSNTDYVKQVYVDDEIVLSCRHPHSWLKNRSISSSSETSIRSEAYPLDEPLELKKGRYKTEFQANKGNRNYCQLPREYDAKGVCLWIAPANDATQPTPNFVSPPTPKFHQKVWGHRQGIRIGVLNTTDSLGLINVFAGFEATMINTHQPSNSISIRPFVEKSADEIAEIENPQWLDWPELQQSQMNLPAESKIGITSKPKLPDWYKSSLLQQISPHEVKSQDGKTMRIFCHYEDYFSGFPNGARPVIEAIFDADHPNRIGLLPHQAADSTPIKAIQIVTTMDARFRRRRMDLVVDGDAVETITLQKQEKSSKLNDVPGSYEVGGYQTDDQWQTIELTQIPIDQSAQMRKLKFSTDVKNFFEIDLSPSIDPKWAYKGVRNCQTWWLPLPDEAGQADQDFKVEILQTERLPSKLPPPSMINISISGGPVIKSVRITVPMPAEKPIWLEIAPDPL
ncbi:hypothetical protein OAG71_00955 [bacterium]|nr:hypothetical protein [bacterium]